MTHQGIGARLLRKEDDRFMRGRGEYVGDIRLAGMQDAAFLRSPLAHARIRAIRIPQRLRGRVFVAEDLAGVSPIRADTALPGFKSSVQPILATIGATVTHAAIEDGRIPDPTGGFLARVARGIGYRAVRTRGTIGGSLAHADPSADWLACLSALGAEVVVAASGGRRRVPLAGFVRGAMETQLAPGELVFAVRIPRLPPGTRFGFHKICRKAGELADAIGVVVAGPDGTCVCVSAGATTGRPLIIVTGPRLGQGAGRTVPSPLVGEGQGGGDSQTSKVGAPPTPVPSPQGGGEPRNARDVLASAGFKGDAYDLALHAAALERAFTEALAP
jgi:carbon-monoxide dehydrogenase medium subunit